MVTGAAKTVNAKDGRVFKVGAADSALLRSLLSHAADDASSFVLVSPDKDVPYAFKAWKRESPVLYANIADAAKAVFPAVPSNAQLQAACLAFLSIAADDLDLGRLSGDIVGDLYDDYTSDVIQRSATGRHYESYGSPTSTVGPWRDSR